MLDKTYRTEFFRTYLIEVLPSPLTTASSHIQIFDNYIANTRMRLRSIRVPETNEWTRVLHQRFPVGDEISQWKIAEMHLNELEYAQLQIFEGNEIRKNRYFHEFDGTEMAFDVFLGDLWGLNIAKVEFETIEEAADHQPPTFAVFDVTGEEFFDGHSLVGKQFEDVRAAAEKLEPLAKGIEDRSAD